MPSLRLLWTTLIVVAALMSATASASAAPKNGCPVGEGWDIAEIDAAAIEIFPNLLPGHPWQTADELAEFLDATYDRNDDDLICVKTMWGDDLNPNAHWYKVGVDLLGAPTVMYLPRDNTASASG
jgi:hypothetical protein